MTAEIYDIKDNSPNQDLIRHLEEVLEQAKSGIIRSHFSVYGWGDDSISHCWSIDQRNSRIRILGESLLAQQNLGAAINLADEDSTLYRALYE